MKTLLFKNISVKLRIFLFLLTISGSTVSAQTTDENTVNNITSNAGDNAPSDVIERHRIWLNLFYGDNYVNQILVGYVTWATQDADPGMDALSFSTDTAISSLIGTNGYVIQGRALPFNCDDIVPLEFKSGIDGDFTISIDHVDGLFDGDQGIFLKDKVTGTVTDLKAGPYTFATLSGTYQSRFELIYQNAPLGIHGPKFNSQVTIYKEEGAIKVNSDITAIKDIKIYDLNGRLVYSKDNINDTSIEINDLKAEKQVLLVQVNAADGSTMTKKIAY